MAGFDIEQFKKAQFVGAMDDHYTPPPPGSYKARVVSCDVSSNPSKKEPNKTVTVLRVMWGLEDPTGVVKQATGQDEARASQDVFLDLTADNTLAGGTGKNIQLGALRTALGQNQKDKPWVPSMLVDAKGTIQVDLEKFTRRDGGDGLKAVVRSVAPYGASVGGSAARPSAMPSRPAAR